jgi:hypothetical protein
MMPNQLRSAISRLTVRPGPDGDVTGNLVYLQALAAFNRGGAGGWHWHNRRPGMPPADEGAARCEFAKWLQKARESDVQGYTENMGRYRTALNAAIAAGGTLPLPASIPQGHGWPPPRPGIEWQRTQHYAALLISEARAIDAHELSVEGGQKSRANARAKTDGRVLSKAHEVLAENKRKSPPSCWNAAGTIAERLNHNPQQKRVADILARLASEPDNRLPTRMDTARNEVT